MSERKVVLITGGSRGIGKCIAKEFALSGANIAITYRAENEETKETIKEIEKIGVKVLGIESNVADFNSCEQVIQKVTEVFGRIDVLVNNAGITKDTLLIRMKEEDFNSVIDINLKGTFNMIKHVSPIMIKQKSGRIINIASVVGLTGNAGQCNYAASKAGIIGLTKACAKELASRNILVNAVAPGFIKTDMTQILSDNVKENILANIPLKRMGEAEEVASVVRFLASDDSKYITGQIINIDGGMVM